MAGTPGDYTVTVKTAPRYVNENVRPAANAPRHVRLKLPMSSTLAWTDAKRLPAPQHAFPQRYVMDPAMSTDDRDKVKEACKYDAIDF